MKTSMRRSTFLSSSISLVLLFLISTDLHTQSAHELWFDEPAEHFEETLILGNGTMGASVFSGLANDSIFLNDATLWSGEPEQASDNPGAHRNLAAIRAALEDDNYALADSLQRGLQGHFSQSYAPLGTLHLAFPTSTASRGRATNYHRSLDLKTATAHLRYKRDGINYTREYFVSHPDQVMVIRLRADQPDALNFELSFNSLLRYNTDDLGNSLAVSGYAPYHAEPSYRGDIPNAVRFDPERGTRFSGRFRVKSFNGRVAYHEDHVSFINGSEAVILVALATSFNGFDKDPAREGKDSWAIAEARLESASKRTYDELKRNHLRDHQSFYQRTNLDLGPTTAPDLPTDKRLQRYGTGAEDKNLEALYLHYGRYLLIAGSRTPEVPVNLQGIWNPYLRPPWSSNYTININAEENYWPAETGNLPEMHQPLLGFVQNIAKTGESTARNYYGTRGWAAGHNSDIWATSNPVGDYGKTGKPNWANWNMGGVWLSTHLWEHYLFTRDEEFLRENAYPVLSGAARFCLDWLIPGPNGELLTAPATSPEARYITDEGYVGATLYGGSADIAFIRENFQQVRLAAELLGLDANLVQEIKAAEKRLMPYKISAKGHLQEWYHDWEDYDPKHRHQTHLFGLHPGHHITPGDTPELAAACRKTLEMKGDKTTGWSKGWRINLWARLHDGDRAHKMLRELLRFVEPTGMGNGTGGGGTYANLFDAHPPFQIDGNFGGAAAIMEMIVQSSPDRILLLPALPFSWPDGQLKGVCTRSGHELDISWKGGKVSSLIIRARRAGAVEVVEGAKQKRLKFAAGEVRSISWK